MRRIGLPAFGLSGVRCDHQHGVGRPRTAAAVQTRLRFDRPVPRQRPRDPVGEFLLVGRHATRLSFAGRVLHVPHRKHLRRSADAPRRPVEDYTSISEKHHTAFANRMRTVTRTGRDADVNPGGSLGLCSKRPSAARAVRGWLDAEVDRYAPTREKHLTSCGGPGASPGEGFALGLSHPVHH
jgi:hypothetical protein